LPDASRTVAAPRRALAPKSIIELRPGNPILSNESLTSGVGRPAFQRFGRLAAIESSTIGERDKSADPIRAIPPIDETAPMFAPRVDACRVAPGGVNRAHMTDVWISDSLRPSTPFPIAPISPSDRRMSPANVEGLSTRKKLPTSERETEHQIVGRDCVPATLLSQVRPSMYKTTIHAHIYSFV